MSLPVHKSALVLTLLLRQNDHCEKVETTFPVTCWMCRISVNYLSIRFLLCMASLASQVSWILLGWILRVLYRQSTVNKTRMFLTSQARRLSQSCWRYICSSPAPAGRSKWRKRSRQRADPWRRVWLAVECCPEVDRSRRIVRRTEWPKTTGQQFLRQTVRSVTVAWVQDPKAVYRKVWTVTCAILLPNLTLMSLCDAMQRN